MYGKDTLLTHFENHRSVASYVESERSPLPGGGGGGGGGAGG